MQYDPSKIEPKWQSVWDREKTFVLPTDVATLKQKPKFYALDMFPYPSGAGLHVGHTEGYTATDVLSRKKRMQGFNVLHPMGWDAFGLPAERAAVRENIHPAIITKRNVDNFRRQVKRLGFSYDWEREINTSSPEYYRWTQWIFLRLYEKGLAYMAEVPVNWCPAMGTVLANEEVKDGKYVETGDPVERRLMKQWMLKITAYAERLLEDLKELDWPEGVIEMQRHWIGKSLGADVEFAIQGSDKKFTVFTTRPDTLFGATYCVLAPEHALVSSIVTSAQKSAVDAYVTQTKNKSEMARTELAKEKTGVFTGAFAINPVTQKALPIWIADYVLLSYGTGAIMAVPAHDPRDHAFATKFKLPIVEVISGGAKPVSEAAHEGDGKLVNSGFLDGKTVEQAQLTVTEWLEKEKKGKGRVRYRLRDWLFSRQRYWGEPFPIAHMQDGTLTPLPESALPVTLPPIDEYKPTEDGQPPLARAPEDWLQVSVNGKVGRREVNTMPQWAGSCWYYLRYIDPKNTKEPWSKEVADYWLPVDLYVGGVEHAVLHLLYARFWHKVLFDCGLVKNKEPFPKLFNQGMILAHSFRDERGKYHGPEAIEWKGNRAFLKGSAEPLESQVEKMSKSKLNVVNLDEVVDQYGADALRLYELFMGPLDQAKPWQMDGVEGISRFLSRVWRLVVEESSGNLTPKLSVAPGDSELPLWKTLHKTIKKVSENTDNLQFNTAISQMMVFVNEAGQCKTLPKETLSRFLSLLCPYAPHLVEELWEKLALKGLASNAAWPTFDEALCIEDTVTIPVQVNGKLREKLELPRDLSSAEIEKMALASDKVQKFLEGKTPKRVIVVPNRLINIVV